MPDIKCERFQFLAEVLQPSSAVATVAALVTNAHTAPNAVHDGSEIGYARRVKPMRSHEIAAGEACQHLSATVLTSAIDKRLWMAARLMAQAHTKGLTSRESAASRYPERSIASNPSTVSMTTSSNV